MALRFGHIGRNHTYFRISKFSSSFPNKKAFSLSENPCNNLTLLGCYHIYVKGQSISKETKMYFGSICNKKYPTMKKIKGKQLKISEVGKDIYYIPK